MLFVRQYELLRLAVTTNATCILSGRTGVIYVPQIIPSMNIHGFMTSGAPSILRKGGAEKPLAINQCIDLSDTY